VRGRTPVTALTCELAHVSHRLLPFCDSVAGNHVQDEGATALFEVLAVTPCRLEYLDLSGNELTYRSGISAGTMLRSNTTLVVLALNYNRLVCCIARSLRAARFSMCDTTARVRAECPQGTAGVAGIAVGARANIHLQAVQVVHNGITERGVEQLVDLMHVNHVMQIIMYAWT